MFAAAVSYFDGRKQDSSGAFARLREDVLDRLLRAQEVPEGFQLRLSRDTSAGPAKALLQQVRGGAECRQSGLDCCTGAVGSKPLCVAARDRTAQGQLLIWRSLMSKSVSLTWAHA